MSKITDRVGATFRRRFEDCLLKPLNWRMIDALATMDEKEDEQRRLGRSVAGDGKSGSGTASADGLKHDKS